MIPFRSKRFLPPLEWQETASCENTPCNRYRIAVTIMDMHHLINYLTEYVRDPNRSLSGEQRLWAAVIRQSALDCIHKSSVSKTNRNRAETFLDRPNARLQLICDFAGLDMDFVLTKSREPVTKTKRSYLKVGSEPTIRRIKRGNVRASKAKGKVSISRAA